MAHAPSSPRSQPGTPGRRRLLRLASVALGLCCVAGVELALRASGRWADPPLPVLPEGGQYTRDDAHGMVVPTTVDGQPGAAAGDPRARMMAPDQWTLRPAEGTLRVFTFGGSTTLGVPFERDPARTFPGQAERALLRAGRPAEVINLGMAGMASGEALGLAGQVADHGAWAWVYYGGNNEYFRYMRELYEANARYPDPRTNLQRLHLFRALEDLVSTGPPPKLDLGRAMDDQRRVVAGVVAATLADPQNRAVERAPGRWTRRDPAHREVVSRYRAHLAALEALAAERGVRLYIADTQANLGHPPGLSLHAPQVPGRVRDRVAALLAQAERARADRQAEQAEAIARQALSLDPALARSWHTLGLALLDQGRAAEAEPALRNALDLDMDPGRPTTDLAQVVREVTADGGAVLIDLADLWHASPTDPLGLGLFFDSCHLTERGYAQVGERVASVLAAQAPPR